MADLTPQDMADKLMATGFSRSGPTAQTLSDPIANTPMVLTLDELRPYELDPRIKRNPLYQEIKASIRERGLDSALQITRRPGADHYIIRNGGNTRLAILRELWMETKDERFFRIHCLFRPWPERGEIIALTGHLAENELRGGLTFIERALGVEKARELYELESGKTLSQSELSRRLAADGFPVQQSHISRMQDTIRYLLPVIPNVLYGGLGRHQIERLAVLRKAAEFTWETYAQGKNLNVDFETLFHDILVVFDTQLDNFAVKRVQDELIGQMAHLLDADYNSLELDIGNTEQRQRIVTSPPQITIEEPGIATAPATGDQYPSHAHNSSQTQLIASPIDATNNIIPETPIDTNVCIPAETKQVEKSQERTHDISPKQDQKENISEQVQGHIVSPASSTERLQAIQQLVTEHTDQGLPDVTGNAIKTIPIQVDGLFPITDVWYVDPSLDSPDRLRIHIVQFAREIAAEAGLVDCINSTDTGLGFTVSTSHDIQEATVFGRTLLALLHALASSHDINMPRPTILENFLLDDGIGNLLLGNDARQANLRSRLQDSGLVKLFRLLRLARRLLESGTTLDEPH